MADESSKSLWRKFMKSSYANNPNSKAIEPIPALSFATMGIIGLLQPQMVANILNYGSLGIEGANEIRAVYGGFGIGVSTLLYLSKGTNLEIGVKLCVATSLIGMASARLFSLALDKQIKTTSLIFLSSELMLAGIVLKGFAHQTIIKQIRSL